jgi:hypothetical protein
VVLLATYLDDSIDISGFFIEWKAPVFNWLNPEGTTNFLDFSNVVRKDGFSTLEEAKKVLEARLKQKAGMPKNYMPRYRIIEGQVHYKDGYHTHGKKPIIHLEG